MSASKLRTVELPTSSLTLNASLRFPTKDASEVLDYSLDCTRWLRDVADTVASFTVSLSPAGAGDLQLDSKNPPGPVLTAFLSRGLVGAQYAVTFLGVTTGGRTFERIVLLQVAPISANPAGTPAVPTTIAPVVPAAPVSYTYTQALPSAVWVIAHGLGHHPVLVVTDTSGSEVEGDVTYDTLNQVTIRFSASFAGSAYLV